MFVTIGAALFLHEQVKARRWSATIIGLLGTVIILRPGVGTMSVYSFLAIGSSVAIAASMILIKVLARTEASNAIVLYMVLLMTPLSLIPALPVWVWPSAQSLGWVALLGAAGSGGHILLTRALQCAETSVMMPFDFVRLPFAAALGYLFLGQQIDLYTWLGAAVIFAAGAYIAQRETRLARRGQLTPNPYQDRSH